MTLKRIILPLLAVLVLAAAAQAQATNTLLQQGDDLYAQRGDLAKAKESLAKYQAALVAGEDAYGVNWRLARVEYWIGDHTADNTVKKQIFQQGIDHAKKANELGPNKVEGHFWLGVCYGVYGEAKGVLKSLFLVKPIKEEMRRVLEIDPAYDKGGADRILGRVFHEVPGIFGGSEKKSLEHLLKAVEYGPRVGLNLLYLADTYISLDQIDKARQTLEYILTMEPEPELIPETTEERVQARQKLEGKPFKKK
ncbi:MAG: TRAP transporter TatT component family protein [Candidatus Aminicenantes bacterium]|nr:TRAP transporter TatT component family protein [Candidatus Aminicenantes bacterium]